MFLLYAVVLGLVLGLLVGGRPRGLATFQFRWAWLAFLGFAIQVVLFTEFVSARVGPVLGPIVYIGSTAIVLVAVLRNLRLAGMPIVALGAASNLAAILANGGYMPVDPGAREAVGQDTATVYSNTREMTEPALRFLTDVIPLPDWLPFTNVISVGDILIGIGAAAAIAIPMWRARPGAPGGASANLPRTAGTD